MCRRVNMNTPVCGLQGVDSEFWLSGLPAGSFFLLLLCSFLGSLLTASLGVGGGAFLLTVMAGILPPLALIPLHGIVQLGSNALRATLTRRYLNVRALTFFALGALLASVVAVFLVGLLNPVYIPLAVGLFILWLSWGRVPAVALGQQPAGLVLGGVLTTLATMLVGATGPLVSAWLGRRSAGRWEYTAIFSACMTVQHVLKVVVFGLAGFSYRDYLPLLLVMILCGYLGTRTGLHLLGRIPEAGFRLVFKWVLTLLAFRLLWLWWVGA